MSLAYEQGSYCRTFYQCRVEGASGTPVLFARRQGAYVPAGRSIEIHVHGVGTVRRAELSSDGGNWRIELEP